MDTKHTVNIRINSYKNMEAFIAILVNEGYKISGEVVMKPYPRESSLDYYKITIEIPDETDIYHGVE